MVIFQLSVRAPVLDALPHSLSVRVQSMFQYFIQRVRSNLHIVLCMSPIGEPFRHRLRMYPAFVNCTTIDWFSEWPLEALLEVADKYLANVELNVSEQDVSAILTLLTRMTSGLYEHGSIPLTGLN